MPPDATRAPAPTSTPTLIPSHLCTLFTLSPFVPRHCQVQHARTARHPFHRFTARPHRALTAQHRTHRPASTAVSTRARDGTVRPATTAPGPGSPTPSPHTLPCAISFGYSHSCIRQGTQHAMASERAERERPEQRDQRDQREQRSGGKSASSYSSSSRIGRPPSVLSVRRSGGSHSRGQSRSSEEPRYVQRDTGEAAQQAMQGWIALPAASTPVTRAQR